MGGLGSTWKSSRKAERDFPPCAAQFGLSVRLSRSSNNLRTNRAFDVASLGLGRSLSDRMHSAGPKPTAPNLNHCTQPKPTAPSLNPTKPN